MALSEKERKFLGLPDRVFLYHFDQICSMLQMSEAQFTKQMVYFEGRSTGVKPHDKLLAKNVAPELTDPAEWRITETELVRWLRHKKLRNYERGWASR